MHGSHHDLLALLLLLVGSLFMPLLSARVRAPSAVLLIGFGIALGPGALDLIHEGNVVDFLYEIGFLVLMFLAGMEIDFNGIRSRGARSLLVVTAICLGIFGLAMLTAALLKLHLIYGLALGAISVGLPLAVLRETGQLRSALGQRLILLGSAGEFLTLVGMTLLYFTSKYGLSAELFLGLGKLVGVLAVAGVTLRLAMAVAWWAPERYSKLVETHDGSEIGVRAALALMTAFSVLAVFAGVESIVGAFLAGALIAFVLRGKDVLEEKLAVVGHGLFIPLFFIIVGLRFDPGAVNLQDLVFVGGLLVAAFLVRLVPSLALLRQGLSVRETFAAASLLSAPLTLMVAIAALGRELEVLDARAQATLIVLAMATGVVFPILYRLSLGAGGAGADDAPIAMVAQPPRR